jgi:hypothetical protein
MGCDIHVTLESKGNEEWWSLGAGMILDRNYRTFAKLAGIRGDGPEPKGLPETPAPKSPGKSGSSGRDHSHSWSTVKEWEEAIDDDAPEYQAILAAAKTLQSHGRETRIVFWFDN